MYESYFGLNERPFSIAPDPQYLYMSSRHKEAMAHLSYGLSQGGCFIVLTGEVGTGKTTLCRNLLTELPENVDIALILNANINEDELLQTVCDELGINNEQGQSQKLLLDAINRHLLTAYSEGRQTVLIIDEAQLLSRDVLESIRLLTNLETTKAKLLQIILIGQPELNDLLARNDLRQLAQRVTARYHLDALRANEIEDYINFRLAVAGCRKPIFTGQALTQLHKLTEGIPRKINVLADHALLAAYAQGESLVSAKTVKSAAKDVFIEHMPSRHRASFAFGYKRWALPALLVVVFNIALWWFFAGQDNSLKLEPSVAEQSLAQANGVPENRELARSREQLSEDFDARAASQVAQAVESEPLPKLGNQSSSESAAVGSFRAELSSAELSNAEQASNDIVRAGSIVGGAQRPASAGSVMIADEFLDFSPEITEETLKNAVDYQPPGTVTASKAEVAQASLESRPMSELGQLGQVLDASADLTGRIKAFRDLVALWGLQLPNQLLAPTCEVVASLGLECQGFDDWAELVRLNRPAIMVVAHNNSFHRIIVREIIADQVEVLVGGTKIRIPIQELLARWNRNGVAIWKPGDLGSTFLQLGDESLQLPAVRARLNLALERLAMPLLNSTDSNEFDLDLSQKLFALQTRFDIIGDSKIGIETYILLNELLRDEPIPKLRSRP